MTDDNEDAELACVKRGKHVKEAESQGDGKMNQEVDSRDKVKRIEKSEMRGLNCS